MKKHFKLTTIILLIMVFGLLIIYKNFNQSKTIETITYSWGSKGAQVSAIQTKLKNWGYYSGTADGVYGTKTYNAVKYFQSKNGLTATGVANTSTLNALGISTTTASSGNNNNLYLLAKAIAGESRGEPYLGQVAVGAVILNRTKNPNFPNSIPGVIYQPGAFTAVTDGQINVSPPDSCLRAARDAMNGWDPTRGCIYYYNPATATNGWIWSRTVMLVIGKHRFAK
jgi:N-acetylmuramoyl-L-alanine amidase